MVINENNNIHIYDNHTNYYNNHKYKSDVMSKHYLIAKYKNILNKHHITTSEIHSIVIQIAPYRYVYIGTHIYEFSIPESEQILNLSLAYGDTTKQIYAVLSHSNKYQYNMTTMKYRRVYDNNAQTDMMYYDLLDVEHVHSI